MIIILFVTPHMEGCMPKYEYLCKDCRRRFEVYMSYDEYGTRPVTCLHCQSTHVQRRIGRIRIARSEDSHLEDLADPAKLEGLEDDPQSLGRVMRQMSRELGEDMGPEFDEVVTRLESGQSPDEIEESMPELGSDAGGPFGADDI
jgi:putative FmdB family regulatory protein